MRKENLNFVASYTQPNPLEVTYWVDLSADPNGTQIKAYNGKDWQIITNDLELGETTGTAYDGAKGKELETKLGRVTTANFQISNIVSETDSVSIKTSSTNIASNQANGHNVNIPAATVTAAGVMSSADKVALTTTIPAQINTKADASSVYTKAETDAKVASLVDQAPETLDTLNELAAALGDDPNFATTVSNQIGLKADKSTTYTKTEIDNKLSLKANSSELSNYMRMSNLMTQTEYDAIETKNSNILYLITE